MRIPDTPEELFEILPVIAADIWRIAIKDYIVATAIGVSQIISVGLGTAAMWVYVDDIPVVYKYPALFAYFVAGNTLISRAAEHWHRAARSYKIAHRAITAFLSMRKIAKEIGLTKE